MTNLTIVRLGARGDGIADTPAGPVFVPGALPGETVRAEVEDGRGRILETLEASPQRVAPPCPHVALCGGCVAQHMAPDLYGAWKTALLAEALAREGLKPTIEPLVTVPPASRRRVVLGLARQGGRTVLGFHGARSHDLVPVSACAVADPAIVAAVPVLAALLSPFAPAKGATDVTVLASAAGLDVSVAAPAPQAPAARTRLTEQARAAGLARISFKDDVLATFRPPLVEMGGVAVVPPPGGFLQAVEAAEAALGGVVVEGVGKAKRVADLFAGAGAFTLRLARRAAVHAVEGDAAAVAALDQARRGVPGLKPITVERRDLFRRPLQPAELKAFDAVVLDPPRQGAEAQIATLAASAVKTVVYVSCNPATFARDAARLVAAGFSLGTVTPVDQFLWSHHLELAAVLRRR